MNYEAKIKELVNKGSQMRTAQQEYFKRIAKARKSKAKEDFESAKFTLQISKDLENDFDNLLTDVEKHFEFAPNLNF